MRSVCEDFDSHLSFLPLLFTDTSTMFLFLYYMLSQLQVMRSVCGSPRDNGFSFPFFNLLKISIYEVGLRKPRWKCHSSLC